MTSSLRSKPARPSAEPTRGFLGLRSTPRCERADARSTGRVGAFRVCHIRDPRSEQRHADGLGREFRLSALDPAHPWHHVRISGDAGRCRAWRSRRVAVLAEPPCGAQMVRRRVSALARLGDRPHGACADRAGRGAWGTDVVPGCGAVPMGQPQGLGDARGRSSGLHHGRRNALA